MIVFASNGDLREKSAWITGVFFFLFALYNFGESVEKSKYGCSVCEKKSPLSPFQKAKVYTRTTLNIVLVFKQRSTVTIVQDAEQLSKTTDGLGSRFIMFGGSSQLPTTAERAVNKSLSTVQTTRQCSAVAGSWEEPPNV